METLVLPRRQSPRLRRLRPHLHRQQRRLPPLQRLQLLPPPPLHLLRHAGPVLLHPQPDGGSHVGILQQRSDFVADGRVGPIEQRAQ